jgi:hypothetical protein
MHGASLVKVELKNYRDWAESSGYKTYDLQTPFDRPALTTRYDFLPNIGDAKKILLKQESENPVLIECINLRIIIWNHPEPNGNYTYTYYFISENDDVLLDDPVVSEYWLQYSPVFYKDNDSWEIRNEYASNVEPIYFDNAPIFVGGRSHFAHWISDTMSNFFVDKEADLKINHYLSSIHTRYQSEALAALGFFEEDNSIHHIDMGTKACKTYKCNKIYIVANFGIRDRFSLLREKINPHITGGDNEKICYMLRGDQRGIRRIANEEEVLNFCKYRGIDIINAGEYSFIHSAQVFSKYSLFISGPSASNTNFSLFSNHHAKFINGQATAFQMQNTWATLGSAWYMLPKLNETELLLLDMQSPNQLSESDNTLINRLPLRYADPVIFDLETLESKLSNFGF